MRRTLEQVYADPIFQAMNPEGKQFLQARWLPPELNHFAVYGIKMAALIPFRRILTLRHPWRCR